jgi:ribosomal-protein-alanine N-acetyltransferase
LLSRPSTDAQAKQLADGEITSFTAWCVESRAENELVLAAGRTRSWLMVAPGWGSPPGCGTRLFFGSAVVPARSSSGRRGGMGWVFTALLGFHKLYSRALLLSARARLSSQLALHPSEPGLLPREFAGARLRRLRRADLASFQAYRRMPELGRYQGWSPMSDAEALAFLDEMHAAPLFAAGEWVQLGIADAGTDELIGDVGLHLSNDGRTGEVGFTLRPSAQGRGIAASAVREGLQLLFGATAATHVLGITDARNLPSIRLLERLGFSYRDSREVVFRGEPCSEKVYVLQRGRAP